MAEKALTFDEQALFGGLCEAMDLDSVALLRGTLDGEMEVAIVVAVIQLDDDFVMEPLAVLVNEDLIDRLTVEGVKAGEDVNL